jgi:excisionase family DNA binding protein
MSHVAHCLSRSQGDVRRLIRCGRLKALRDGDQWRVDPRDFDAYLAQCRQDAMEAIEQSPAAKSFARASA